MKGVWFSSDLHLSHANILKFVNYEGDRVRPEFSSVEEMDEEIVRRHNSVVGQFDKWYCLGDVSMNLTAFHRIMPRLNGRKRLILGNHDKFHILEYVKYFEKIMESWQPVRDVLFTHRPVHLGDHHEKVKFNVHGHVHRTRGEISPKHLNISVEQTNYTPIHWNEIMKKLGKKDDVR